MTTAWIDSISAEADSSQMQAEAVQHGRSGGRPDLTDLVMYVMYMG